MNYLEVFGTLVGLVYLWLEYRASIYLWLACIVMPAVYLVVYYQAGLYADFGINVYYLLASVYGWIAWSRGRKKKNIQQTEEETPITRMPRKVYFPLTAVFILCWVVIAWILITWTDSSVPWTDSFTTALSIIAMWMLARKYVEQWGAWMIVGVLRIVHLQGAVFHFGTVRALCGSGLFRMEKVAEPDDGTGI